MWEMPQEFQVFALVWHSPRYCWYLESELMARKSISCASFSLLAVTLETERKGQEDWRQLPSLSHRNNNCLPWLLLIAENLSYSQHTVIYIQGDFRLYTIQWAGFHLGISIRYFLIWWFLFLTSYIWFFSLSESWEQLKTNKLSTTQN